MEISQTTNQEYRMFYAKQRLSFPKKRRQVAAFKKVFPGRNIRFYMPHPTGHIASVVSYKAACFMAGCILRSYRCSYGLWHWAIWCYKTNKSVGRFQRGDFYGDYQNEEALPPNRTGYKHSVFVITDMALSDTTLPKYA
ncbi:MAG: hypothetical protein K1V81_06190 [Paramuribaculum sp.]|jgi:hypothetical protein|nr:hypothetical protein [Paramuribaculum sp.]